MNATARRGVQALLLSLCLPAGVHAQAGPYAGQQHREIKALSPQDRAALLEGQGLGYAKAAELNGYPGPTHVLELAKQLQLTPRQLEASRQLLADHKQAARRLGAAIVEAERALDAAFASRSADEPGVRRMTADIARLQGELRAEHLRAHLAQAALLEPGQIERYARLRGYTGAPEHRRGGGTHRH